MTEETAGKILFETIKNNEQSDLDYYIEELKFIVDNINDEASQSFVSELLLRELSNKDTYSFFNVSRGRKRRINPNTYEKYYVGKFPDLVLKNKNKNNEDLGCAVEFKAISKETSFFKNTNDGLREPFVLLGIDDDDTIIDETGIFLNSLNNNVLKSWELEYTKVKKQTEYYSSCIYTNGNKWIFLKLEKTKNTKDQYTIKLEKYIDLGIEYNELSNLTFVLTDDSKEKWKELKKFIAEKFK